MITCYGVELKTRKDVLAHYWQVPFAGDRRPLWCCNKHPRRSSKACTFCRGAKFVNDIDKSLWKRGLTLTVYLPR